MIRATFTVRKCVDVGYVPAPHCIYENVFKLEPGMTLTLDQAAFAREQPRIEPYWRFEDAAPAGVAEPILDESEALECIKKALRDAVRLQLMTDVPLGVFLSGGIDSSTIVALMQQESSRPVKSFTVGFNEDGFDEAPHAGAVARHIGTDHHEVYVSPAETQAVIPELPTSYDEPFADSSQIPTGFGIRKNPASVRTTVAEKTRHVIDDGTAAPGPVG